MDIRCFWEYIKNLNMNSAEFKKELCKLFTIKGFMCKGTHFYRNITDEVMIVFGLQHSAYGAYYYMEYGYCFKTINQHLPYPKYTELNLRCGRIMTAKGQRITPDTLNDFELGDFETKVDALLQEMESVVVLGKSGFIDYYLTEKCDESWHVVGMDTVEYFNLPIEAFQYHIELTD